MFEKLRLKFVFINMSLLTFVFVVIFCSLFYITTSNLNSRIEMDLEYLVADKKLPPHVVYVIASLDKDDKIKNITKSFDSEISIYSFQNKIYEIKSKNQMRGRININESSYSYLVNKKNFKNEIIFIDRTYVKDILIDLVKSFFIIMFFSLVVLLLISIYLTNKSIKPVKESFYKQKEFITNASHELKTPLTIIKTNLSIILSNKEEKVLDQIKWINSINNQTERMSVLINEMLSLSKLEIDNTNLVFEKLNISDIVENMLLMFDAIIFENNITLETNISKDLFINGDKESIKKLFSILMDNAIKYTNKNGQINVFLLHKKNKIKLIVENTGYGIEKEYLDKIFERFYRVDDSRNSKTGGYGIGLSIANAIVKQHNAKIFAQSEINKKTSFVVEFKTNRWYAFLHIILINPSTHLTFLP